MRRPSPGRRSPRRRPLWLESPDLRVVRLAVLDSGYSGQDMAAAGGGGRVDATWRLGRVASHLLSAAPVVENDQPYNGGFIVTSLLEPPPLPPSTTGLTDEQLAGYVTRGFINLPRELIGLDPDHHRRVHAHHRAGRLAHGAAGHAYASWEGDNIFNHMDANPGVLEVINSPALIAAVGSILGPNWAIVPYANSVIEADAGDQHWCGAAHIPRPHLPTLATDCLQ